MSRTYLITGGTGGIGKATAELLRSRGEKVITADIKGADINCDLTTAEGREELAEKTRELSGGQLNAVIANAGMQAPIAKTVQVNYFGAVATLDGVYDLLAWPSWSRCPCHSTAGSSRSRRPPCSPSSPAWRTLTCAARSFSSTADTTRSPAATRRGNSA